MSASLLDTAAKYFPERAAVPLLFGRTAEALIRTQLMGSKLYCLNGYDELPAGLSARLPIP